MQRLITAVLCASLCIATPSAAHHSTSGYVSKSGVFVTGTVKEFRWANPHVMLTIEVAEAGRPATEVVFEPVSVGQLEKTHFSKTMVAAGDTVTVSYFPRRDRKSGGFFYGLTTADGKTSILDRPNQLKGNSFQF